MSQNCLDLRTHLYFTSYEISTDKFQKRVWECEVKKTQTRTRFKLQTYEQNSHVDSAVYKPDTLTILLFLSATKSIDTTILIKHLNCHLVTKGFKVCLD